MQEIVNSFVSKVYLNSEIKEKKIVIVKHRKPSSPIELPCTQQWKTEDFDLGQYILTFLCTFTPKPHYTFCSFYFLFSAILHLLSLSLIPPPSLSMLPPLTLTRLTNILLHTHLVVSHTRRLVSLSSKFLHMREDDNVLEGKIKFNPVRLFNY